VTGLRPYQQAALDALATDWASGLTRLGIALPTGTGKTHVMAELALRHAVMAMRTGSVLVLVHRDTLVDQTEARMRQHCAPMRVTVGVVKAKRNVVGASVIVASVHTLRNELRLAQLVPPSLIIVDEAHVSMSDTYKNVFERFPNARVAGFTATWMRSDSRRLGDFWQKISYRRSASWAIREGYLVLPRAFEVGPDSPLGEAPAGVLDGVRTRGGDYQDGDLGEAVTIDEIRQNVVRGYRTMAPGRPSVLFAPTKHAAEYFGQALRDAGVPTAGIYDTTSRRDRHALFGMHRKGTVRVLTTCTALAEGWDAPWASCALRVRPTKSPGRYVQEIGRVLRPWPGKRDALVLDFVGSSSGMSINIEAVLTRTPPSELGIPVGDDEEFKPDELTDGDVVDDVEELTFVVRKGTKPVDLFAGTGARWLTTDRGVPFVATRTMLYFLCEVDGAWNVGMCSRDSLIGGRWLLEGAQSSDALYYASAVAIDDDSSIASTDAAWRRGTSKPTQAQISYARSHGIPVTAEDTKTSLSDKFTTWRANATLASIGAAS
jgi:superfamily II DNA or RNA helicase